MAFFSAGTLAAGIGAAGSIGGSLLGASASKSAAKKELRLQKEMFEKQQSFLKEGRDKAVETLQNAGSGLSWQGQRARDSATYELGMFPEPKLSDYMNKGGPGYARWVQDKAQWDAAQKDPNYGRANKQYTWDQWQKNPLYSGMPSASLGEQLLQGPQLNERGAKTGLKEFERQYGFNPFPLTNEEILAQDPGYRFTKQQGLRSVNAQAAKMGQLYSGGRDKAIANYVTGLANQTIGDIMERNNNLMNSFVDRMTSKSNAQNDAKLRNWQSQANTWNQRLDQARTGFQGAIDNDTAFKNRVLNNFQGVYDYENKMNQTNKTNIANAYTNTAAQLSGSAGDYASRGGSAIGNYGQAAAGGWKALGGGFNEGLQGVYGAYKQDQMDAEDRAWKERLSKMWGI